MSLTANQSKTGGKLFVSQTIIPFVCPDPRPFPRFVGVSVTSHRVARDRQAKKLTAG